MLYAEAIMSYSSKADIQKEISDEELIGLTDDEGAGQINDDRITAAIAKADGIIDSYCGQVTDVPFIIIPAIIKQHSITIAIYFLFSRRSAAPEIRKDNYKDAIAHLKDISTGKATIGTTTEDDYEDKADISSGDRIFTRDKLKGF
jgi:phage gp36-like protein